MYLIQWVSVLYSLLLRLMEKSILHLWISKEIMPQSNNNNLFSGG